MEEDNKIEIMKQAMVKLIRDLPPTVKFSIVCFGTFFDAMY